jgi:dethiobiotin synthetase
MIRLGITGADTAVGKTVVTCAMAAALSRAGLHVAAMKPIETGVEPDDPDRDGARLKRAARDDRPLSMLAPLTYPDAVSPLVASRRDARPIDLARLDTAIHTVAHGTDVLLVEGAGGLLVPITERVTWASLFTKWTLDLVVVAVNRLGVINHVRLTLAVARGAGLRCLAVVLNDLTTAPPDSSAAENARVIAELERIPVCQFPWIAELDDLDHAADVAERSGLIELIAPAYSRNLT